MEKKRAIILIIAILVAVSAVYILANGYFSILGNVIVDSSTRTIVTCEDSDNGKEPYVKGNTTQTYLEDTAYRKKGTEYFYDSCSYGDTMLEYFCTSTNYSAATVVHCEDGCKDGACITKQAVVKETPESEEQEEAIETTPTGEEAPEKPSSVFAKVIDFFKKIFGG